MGHPLQSIIRAIATRTWWLTLLWNVARCLSLVLLTGLFVGGVDYNGSYPAISKVDGDGNFIAYRNLTECYNEPTNMCQGEIYDSFISDNLSSNSANNVTKPIESKILSPLIKFVFSFTSISLSTYSL